MVGAERIDRVDDLQAALDLRHVRRQLHVLDRHDQILGPAADLRGGVGRAVRQQVAQPLAADDLVQDRQHRVGIPEAQLDPAGVRQGEDALLEAVHGEGDGRAGRDGVQAVLGADLVGQRHGVQVTDAAVGAEGGQRLVLRAAVERVHLRALVLGLDHAFAADRAGVAGVVVLEDRVGHRLAGQRLRLRKGAAEPVAGRQPAHRVLEHEHAGGAVVLQPLHVREVRERAGGLARQPGHGLLIRDVDLAVAAHRDRLQVLAAHHRAHAGAAVRPVGHVDDACQPGEALARGADLRHLDLGVAQLLLDGCFRVAR